MISKVHIQNFQSLKDVTLELGNFTVVVGENDQGKSALLRSLNGFFYNDAHPDSVFRGTGTASVTGVVDGKLVKWTKGAKNSYLLKLSKDSPNIEFHKIGKRVPEEVVKLLNVQPVNLVGEDLKLQYQSQFDGPIIVAKSSGVLAQLLDQLIGVSVLTKASGFCRKDLNAAQNKHKFTVDALSDVEVEKSKWEGVFEKIERVKKLYDRHAALMRQLELIKLEQKKALLAAKIKLLGESAAENEAKILRLKRSCEFLKLVKEAKICREVLRRFDEKYDKQFVGKMLADAEVGVQKIKSSVQFLRVSERVAKSGEVLGRFDEKYDKDGVLQSLKEVGDRISGVQVMCSLGDMEIEMVSLESHLTKDRGLIIGVNKEREEWMAELSVCPNCGSGLTETTKHTLLSCMGMKSDSG